LALRRKPGVSYKRIDRKPALVFDIFLPKRMSYASKLAEVLNGLVSESAITEIPAVKDLIRKHKDDSAGMAQFIEKMRDISGYSIYEVDGGFAGREGPVDERTWVIRLIIHDPRVETGTAPDFNRLAEAVVEHLIAHRFAEELGTEDEIWVLQYENCGLTRWVKER
jgi:hypothetical protein